MGMEGGICFVKTRDIVAFCKLISLFVDERPIERDEDEAFIEENPGLFSDQCFVSTWDTNSNGLDYLDEALSLMTDIIESRPNSVGVFGEEVTFRELVEGILAMPSQDYQQSREAKRARDIFEGFISTYELYLVRGCYTETTQWIEKPIKEWVEQVEAVKKSPVINYQTWT